MLPDNRLNTYMRIFVYTKRIDNILYHILTQRKHSPTRNFTA